MIKKYILAAISAAAMLFAGQAYAVGSNTANMLVTLTNVGTATVATTPVAFGSVGTDIANPTGTGDISVTASNGLPYTMSINRGASTPVTAGYCRTMNATDGGAQNRRYALYSNVGMTTAWGDSDAGATCNTGTNNAGGGAKLAGTGSGSAQAHTVYGKAFGGNKTGPMQDTVVVTVAW